MPWIAEGVGITYDVRAPCVCVPFHTECRNLAIFVSCHVRDEDGMSVAAFLP